MLCRASGRPWHRLSERGRYLLPGERDHVQGPVHEASHHHLVPVLREHGIVHAVVGRHVLTEEDRTHTMKVYVDWFSPLFLNWWLVTQKWVAGAVLIGLYLRGQFPFVKGF